MKRYIRKIQSYIRKHPIDIARIAIIIIFLGLACLALYLSFTYETEQWVITNTQSGKFFAHILINIAPELAGMIIGVVTIDYLNERRQDEQLKRQLVLQMGSKHNDVTDTAIKTLRSYDWLADGTLKGANLWNANLEKSKLRYANLEGTFLGRANLKKSVLADTNLKRAFLMGANLKGAYMLGANLEKADLLGANLRGVNLSRVKNWTLDQLLQAKSLEGAIMPDGRLYEEWILDDEEE